MYCNYDYGCWFGMALMLNDVLVNCMICGMAFWHGLHY